MGWVKVIGECPEHPKSKLKVKGPDKLAVTKMCYDPKRTKALCTIKDCGKPLVPVLESTVKKTRTKELTKKE